jgi:hypothetical protein
MNRIAAVGNRADRALAAGETIAAPPCIDTDDPNHG